ncbi:MAG: rhomboid family intramembrane serine protease [Chloroflexota bacterium]
MFPIGDDNSARRTVPVVTYVFIVINVLVFLMELSAGDAFVQRWSVVPSRLLANPVGDFITVFTAMFMHGGWLHLLGNMLYLWIFGDNVEDRLGRVKYVIFYLLCGIVATFAQVLVNPNSNIPNLGASGAIAGVLGAYLLMFPRGSVRVLMGRGIIPMPALVVIGFWAVLQFFNGFGAIAATEQTADTGGVAYMAHVGGFVAGLILAPLMGGTRQQQPRLRSY